MARVDVGSEMVRRSRFSRVVDAAGVAATALMVALLLVRLASSVHGRGGCALVVAVPAGLLAADLASAFAHWFGDTFFTEKTPLLGALVRPFRLHHEEPGAFVRHGFFERNRNNCLAALPLLVSAYVLCPQAGTLAGAFVVGALSFASIALAAATQLHAFSHDRQAPHVVRWLQRRGVLLSPEHHARHHRGAHDRVYGIVNGWSNGVLDRCRVFRFLKRLRAREGVATDLAYLFSNQVLTFALALPASRMLTGVRYEPIARAIASHPVVLQVLGMIVVVDLFQYGIHRLFHEVQLLWRIHAIHHSSPRLDWLAGSRLHFVDVLVMRTLTMAPVFVCGFSETAVHSYAVLAAVTGAVVHADVHFRFVFLEHIIVTPRYHALHHAADVEGSGKNFAFHLPVIDRIFGTQFLPSHTTPLRYGIRGRQVPAGWLHQLLFPLQSLFRSI